jgi:hypothetical protein
VRHHVQMHGLFAYGAQPCFVPTLRLLKVLHSKTEMSGHAISKDYVAPIRFSIASACKQICYGLSTHSLNALP